jgi:aspartate aminotransferase
LPVVKAMGNVQSQETSNPSSISQYAALAALEGDQKCVEDMRREFEARRDLVCKLLSALPGIRCPIPDGAFYAFFNVSSYFGKTLAGHKIVDSTTFCAAALEVAHVNLVPGSAFGGEGYARLSFATSRQQIEAGVARLGELLTGKLG